MVDTDEIGKAYDHVSPIVNELSEGQFHLWYWYHDEDDASLPEAMRRITRKVADTLALRPGEHLLDAGCGSGGPAIQLAIETGVTVTGITVSGVQVAEAGERAAASGVADRARFRFGDFGDLSFADGDFDAVLALESLQCAPDLARVLGEFRRVLRPGGRLTVTEFTREEGMDDEQAAELSAGLGINPLRTVDGWLTTLAGAGFDVEEYTQCGPRVFGRRKTKFHQAAADRRKDLVEMFGESAISQFHEGLEPFFRPAADHLGYAIITAGKSDR